MSIKRQGLGLKLLRDSSEFSKIFRWLIVGLLLVVSLLYLLVALSGPRLRQVEVDTKKVTSHNNQRIVLHFNQPLTTLKREQVRIEPVVDFSVVSNANVVTITLKEKMDYHTRYQLILDDIVALHGSKKRIDISHDIYTSDPNVYYLRRGGMFGRTEGIDDGIYSTTLNGQEETLLYSAPRIQSFVRVGDKLVVVTIDPDEKNGIETFDLRTQRRQVMQLPARGFVDQLHSAENGHTYGFRFSDDLQPEKSNYQNSLMIHNMSPGHQMTRLSGIDGNPMQIIQWRFAPDGTSIVAQTYDTNLVLLDTANGHKPEALGQFKGMGNFSFDGVSLLVRRVSEFALLNIPQRQITTADELATHRADGVMTGDVWLLSNRPGKITQVWEQKDGKDVQSLVLWTDGGSRTLRSSDPFKQQVLEYGTTTNDQFMYISGASDAPDDEYPGFGLPTRVQTEFSLLSAGKIHKTVSGSNPVVGY